MSHGVFSAVISVYASRNMSDPTPSASGLQIPDETQAKFAPLIELIKASESMNTEEKQYWINILPIMTPEQLKNLEDILVNEKKQLAAIDAKYTKNGSGQSNTASVDSIEEKIKSRKKDREAKELEDAKKEELHEEDILASIESL